MKAEPRRRKLLYTAGILCSLLFFGEQILDRHLIDLTKKGNAEVVMKSDTTLSESKTENIIVRVSDQKEATVNVIQGDEDLHANGTHLHLQPSLAPQAASITDEYADHDSRILNHNTLTTTRPSLSYSPDERKSIHDRNDTKELKDSVLTTASGEVLATSQIQPEIRVFINTFIPDKGQETTDIGAVQSLGIVQEQVGQISNSYAGSYNITVHIVTVGRDFVNSSMVEKLCSDASGGRIKCTHPPHSGRGELDTLQHLHSYCLKALDTTRAIYIHNKGSLHPSKNNRRWRKAMLDAVVSEECLDPPNGTCNACGLLFEAPPRMFTLLFPGNFFAASCQYIKRLLPPLEFENRHTTAVKRAIGIMGRSGGRRFHFSGKKPWLLGLGRYTAEHWIGSHPSIQPCDMSVEEDYWYWEKHEHSLGEFQWSMFPRRAYNASHEFAHASIYLGEHGLRLRLQFSPWVTVPLERVVQIDTVTIIVDMVVVARWFFVEGSG